MVGWVAHVILVSDPVPIGLWILTVLGLGLGLGLGELDLGNLHLSISEGNPNVFRKQSERL